MHVLVTGAAGMIGGKLVERLRRDGRLGDKPIEKMTLADIAHPGLSDGVSSDRVEVCSEDISIPGFAEILVEKQPELILHLPAVVSGEAELDLEKGYRVNLDGTRLLLEAVRKIGGGYRPRFVFASSYAVFGAPFPQDDPKRFSSHAADQLRDSKGDRRAVARRLFEAGLCRRNRVALPGDLRAPGSAQPGRLRFLLQHHPGTARREGSHSARARDGAPHPCVAASRGEFPHPRRDHGHRCPRRAPFAVNARRQRNRPRTDCSAGPG